MGTASRAQVTGQEAAGDRYGLGATVLTADMHRAQAAWRTLPIGTVKVSAVFGGAPGGAAQPRGRAVRASASGRSCSTR